jgi:serine protease AprX
MTIRRLLTICFFLGVYMYTQAQRADVSTVDIALQSADQVQVIIWMQQQPTYDDHMRYWDKQKRGTYVYSTLTQIAQHSQKPILELLQAKGLSYQSFYVANAIKTTIDRSLLDELRYRSDIKAILHDKPFYGVDYRVEEPSLTTRSVEPEWGIKMIKADSVWLQGFTGQGVVVGGLDTGFEWDISVVRNKYRGYTPTATTHDYHWHDAIRTQSPINTDSLNPCGFNVAFPCDDNNHGTHTMGTMIGSDSSNLIGVAPEAQWVACRNMDRGWGQPSTYLECLEWMLAPTDLNNANPDPKKSPHVINNSWYCSEQEGCNPSNFLVLEEAVKNLKASGIVVVVSIGNWGSSCGSATGPPGLFEPSFSVGATNAQDTIAGFSSRGPSMVDSTLIKPNVSAPGVGVRSVIRGGGFANFSGTSMAGPHVAGLVALMISARPEIAGFVEEIEDIIEATALPRYSEQTCGGVSGQSIPNNTFGHGRIQALQAIARARQFVIPTQDISDDAVTIYPNPGQNLIQIQWEKLEVDHILIRNVQGMLIRKIPVSIGSLTHYMETGDLPTGLYIISLAGKSRLTSLKWVKM